MSWPFSRTIIMDFSFEGIILEKYMNWGKIWKKLLTVMHKIWIDCIHVLMEGCGCIQFKMLYITELYIWAYVEQGGRLPSANNTRGVFFRFATSANACKYRWNLKTHSLQFSLSFQQPTLIALKYFRYNNLLSSKRSGEGPLSSGRTVIANLIIGIRSKCSHTKCRKSTFDRWSQHESASMP